MAAAEPRVPLSPRWLEHAVGAPRAGATATARLVLENAGSATWRSRGREGLQVSYHWLDPLDNPIVWDGPRTPLPRAVAPGERVELRLEVTAPRPPGRYRLRFDLVEEHRFWLEELGCETLDVDVDVLARIDERRLAVVVHGGDDPLTTAALEAQEERLAPPAAGGAVAVAHLVAGAVPARDWSRRLLDAHAEGWAAVGPAVALAGARLDRRAARRLAPWAPGSGRNPRLGRPLLLPSLLAGLEPEEHLGLPAYESDDALFDGRIVVTLRPRSGRRPS